MPSDEFNRANGALGANWTTFGGWSGLEISSNQLVPTSAGVENAAYYNAWTPGSADQYAQIRVVSYGNGGPMVRVVPGSTSGYLAIGQQYSTELYRVVSGGYTQIGSGIGLQAAGGSGLILRIEAQGTAIRLIYGGTTLIDVTDSTLTDAGVGGAMYEYHNAAGVYDEWAADLLGAAVVAARIGIAPVGFA